MNKILRPVVTLLIAVLAATQAARAADALVKKTWQVDGVTREALVHVPPAASAQPAPVVFAFHGHGGTMQNAARSFRYHTLWPEAIVVYMQGLKTPGRLTDPDGKRPGWQHAAGDHGDRDLKFFDAVLASLRAEQRIDDRRIYSTGHSNGGGFTYLLWATRGDVCAAMAPSASSAAMRQLASLKPKPVLHVAGEKDELVKFAWQQQTIAALKKLNQSGAGETWEKIATRHPSPIGAPVYTYIHPGAHGFPTAAPALIVTFFKQHAKP